MHPVDGPICTLCFQDKLCFCWLASSYFHANVPTNFPDCNAHMWAHKLKLFWSKTAVHTDTNPAPCYGGGGGKAKRISNFHSAAPQTASVHACRAVKGLRPYAGIALKGLRLDTCMAVKGLRLCVGMALKGLRPLACMASQKIKTTRKHGSQGVKTACMHHGEGVKTNACMAVKGKTSLSSSDSRSPEGIWKTSCDHYIPWPSPALGLCTRLAWLLCTWSCDKTQQTTVSNMPHSLVHVCYCSPIMTLLLFLCYDPITVMTLLLFPYCDTITVSLLWPCYCPSVVTCNFPSIMTPLSFPCYDPTTVPLLWHCYCSCQDPAAVPLLLPLYHTSCYNPSTIPLVITPLLFQSWPGYCSSVMTPVRFLCYDPEVCPALGEKIVSATMSSNCDYCHTFQCRFPSFCQLHS